MKVHHYKKLIVWQKSMELVRLVYLLLSKLPKEEQFGLGAQLRRAVISVPSNIAEGSHRSSQKDFAQFLHIAMGSAAEVETQIEAGILIGFWSKKEVELVLALTDEILRMLSKLVDTQKRAI